MDAGALGRGRERANGEPEAEALDLLLGADGPLTAVMRRGASTGTSRTPPW
ncbi:hypothetical protein [Streptomyces fuscigenes]|uniref:hypothetical protein n=1 Tax=Streptomyces fuscigenes TaxID=1528880 RepID=UPI001F1EA537|nr:hypothetical protein [Streptomyces fuscigenes]